MQIPGDGKPLILMADRQPTGDYANGHAHATSPAGECVPARHGLCRVSVDGARAALFAREDEIAQTVQRLRPLRRALTCESLFEANLTGGVLDPLDSGRIEEKF